MSATGAARVVTLLVLAGGVAVVVAPVLANGSHFMRDPDARHAVGSTVVEAQFGGVTTTTVVASAAGTTTTVVSDSPAPRTTLTTSIAEEKPSFLERSFGYGGFFLFRVALAVVAAFLAGALAQRALLGRFAIKLPFVELDDVSAAAAASTDALAALRAGIDTQINTVVDKMSDRLSASADATARAIGGLHGELTTLEQTVAELRRATESVGDRVAQLER